MVVFFASILHFNVMNNQFTTEISSAQPLTHPFILNENLTTTMIGETIIDALYYHAKWNSVSNYNNYEQCSNYQLCIVLYINSYTIILV